jgi:hypothetical protein
MFFTKFKYFTFYKIFETIYGVVYYTAYTNYKNHQPINPQVNIFSNNLNILPFIKYLKPYIVINVYVLTYINFYLLTNP